MSGVSLILSGSRRQLHLLVGETPLGIGDIVTLFAGLPGLTPRAKPYMLLLLPAADANKIMLSSSFLRSTKFSNPLVLAVEVTGAVGHAVAFRLGGGRRVVVTAR